jgi:hypothetical protein
VLREAWAAVRDRLSPMTRGGWLDAAAERMFSGNAREVYRLTG